MANKSVFATIAGKLLPPADARNHEGIRAYRLSPHQALAQLAATGTFNATFYAEPREQLDEVLKLAWQVEPGFLARTAVHAFEQGYMKDMPALLLAVLSSMQGDEFGRAFGRIVRTGKMLRNFVQVMRSGATGRKSLGTRPKRLVQAWLEQAVDFEIMRAAVGNDPSLADVIKMVHPKPKSASREALYGYLIGKPHDLSVLPDAVKAFEAFKRDPSLPVPEVPFQMLTSMPLSREHWVQIAETAGWQMLRQNLNTFARNGVFEVEGFAEKLAARLRDPEAVRRALVPVPAHGGVHHERCGCARRGQGCAAGRDGNRARQRTADQRQRGRVSGCFGLDGLAGNRLPQGRDLDRALHRCGCPGGRRDAAAQPDGEGVAVRERCG